MALFWILLVAIGGVAVVPANGQVSAGCPTDAFVSRDGTNFCYLFSSAGATDDWFNANSRCTQQYRDALLASVVDDEENAFIYNSMSSTGASNYWIGLYKIAGDQDGQLRWVDGTPFNYDNFENGEPDNVAGSGSDCVVMNKVTVGQWSDESCTSNKGFVCKTRKVDIQDGSCPSDDWTQSGTSCYYVNVDATSSWSAAQAECQLMGGNNAYLASIYSEAENTVVYNLMNSAGDGTKNVWLGMNRCGDSSNVDNDWFWYDETPFTDYDNWDDLQPDGDGGCAAANLAGGFSRWEEVDCAARLGVFCKGPKVTSCDVGFVEWNGFCYYVNPTLQLAWSDARDWCALHVSSTIGSLANSAEASFVNDIAQSTGSDAHSYWIGLYKYTNDAPWTWSDGSSKAIVKWADGEPSNTGGSDRCATTGLATGQWFSSTCDRAYPYVCKAVPGDGNCIGQFESFNSACYLFVGDDTQTLDNAFTQCKLKWDIAQLVSLLTSSEHDFVYERMVNETVVPQATDYWIGYQRCDVGDQIYSWTWLDSGRTIVEGDYQNFVLPVNQESCAIMNENSNWTDFNCNLGRGFACKVTALEPPTTTTTTRRTPPPTTTSNGGGSTTTSGGGASTTTSRPRTTTDPDEGGSGGGGLSSGDVVGIVFGVLIGVALISVAGIFGYIYVLKPRMAGGGGGGASSGKDTTAFAFANTTYSDGQDADV